MSFSGTLSFTQPSAAPLGLYFSPAVAVAAANTVAPQKGRRRAQFFVVAAGLGGTETLGRKFPDQAKFRSAV
jgi:hypothetical protein